MTGENTDQFDQALKDAGVEFGGDDSQESAEQQEQQSSSEESTSQEETEETSEENSSETQETEENSEESEEGNSEEENSEESGKTEKKSGIIDLSNDDEEESSSETTDDNESQSSINFSEMLGEGFETIDDVKAHIEYAEGLEAQLQELEGKEPEFANDFVKQMNDYVKQGGDPSFFAKVQSVDVEALSPMDALKLDLQWKHNISETEAEVLIKETYKNEDFDAESGEIDPKSVQMKVDASKAKASLKEKQADNTLPEPKTESTGYTDEDLEKFESDRIEAEKQADDLRMWDKEKGWATEVDKAVNGLKDKGIVLDLGNGKGFQFVYNKDESYTEDLLSKVDQALYDSGMSRDDQPELASVIAENIFFMENKAEIMKAYGDEIRSMKDNEYHQLNNNPSAIKRGDKTDANKDVVTDKDVLDQLKSFD